MAAIRLSEMSELELAKRGIVLESFQAAIGRWASYEPFADSTDDFPVFRAWINGNRYRLTSAAMKRNGLIVVKVARRYRKDCYGKRRASGLIWRTSGLFGTSRKRNTRVWQNNWQLFWRQDRTKKQ